MDYPAFARMAELAREPDAFENTICYLSEHLHFLKKQEQVLICFPNHEPGSIGDLFEQTVLRMGAVPVFWEGDLRWKALLRLAFLNHSSTIIGPPLIILGLTKLARANGTPLYIHNVVMAGYPCKEWMIDGIMKGLDCNMWGFYSIGNSPVVCGATCTQRHGFHLRDEVYGVEIVDAQGRSLPPGENGEIVFYPKQEPAARYYTGETARIEMAPCACGSKHPRLIGIKLERDVHQDLFEFGVELLSWSSILDCRLNKGKYGMEMELVIFPGEKLPKLPSCAKQIIRPWDPENDTPFRILPGIKTASFSCDLFEGLFSGTESSLG